MTTAPLIGAAELVQLLARREPASGPLRLLDARPGARGRTAYEAGHLPGALYADLDTDLAEIGDPAHGGRHPLPSATTFAATLQRLGVTTEHLVIAYDDQGGANAAARLWWMLRSLGHERARALDGGLRAAIAAGIALESGPSRAPAAVAPLADPAWRWPLASIDEVAAAASDPRLLVLDVRSRERFVGLTEPFDPVAGHVPGASNLPFTENLDRNGCFRSPAELRALYRDAYGERLARAIVHCGSGVTACHTLLALESAGLPRPALWIGSWSEWCRSDRPVATGEAAPARSTGSGGCSV